MRSRERVLNESNFKFLKGRSFLGTKGIYFRLLRLLSSRVRVWQRPSDLLRTASERRSPGSAGASPIGERKNNALASFGSEETNRPPSRDYLAPTRFLVSSDLIKINSPKTFVWLTTTFGIISSAILAISKFKNSISVSFPFFKSCSVEMS